MPEEIKSIEIMEEAAPEETLMLPEEVEMAKKHGLIKDGEKADDKMTDKQDDKTEDSSKEKSDVKPLKEEDYDTFDKVHDLYENNKEAYYALPRSIKNQYHNSKGLYKKLKEEEERRKKLEDDGGYNRLQEAVSKAKVERLAKRIMEAKGDPELKGLTLEEIEEILDHKQDIKDDDKPLTKRDWEELQNKDKANRQKEEETFRNNQQRVAERIKETEIYASQNISDLTSGKYNNFDEVVTLAHEMAGKKPRVAKQIAEVLNGEDSVEDIVDVLIDIAKTNPKWGEVVKKEDKVDIERMEKNAQRAKTSASVTAGKGGRVVNYDDLTPEDAGKLSKDQWEKLPREVRKRILSSV